MKKWAWIAAVVALVTVGLVETVRAQDAPPLPPEPTVYLSELRWLRATNGWNGDPRNDASIEDNAIRIRGETYARGIGCHADAEIVYKIYPQFKRFVAVLGVDDEKDGAGTVTFTLLADDKVLFESGKVTAKMPRICVNLELPEGAKELIIKVGDAGDGLAATTPTWPTPVS